MRILAVHNFYRQPGGEDVVYEAEVQLLESRGHEVRREEFRSEIIPGDRSLLDSGRLALESIWSRSAAERIRRAIWSFEPDVVHAHNTFPLVSPAVFSMFVDEGVPVVHTLHNYRLLCAHGPFFRDGRVCEDCLGRTITWPGILHGCYRDSRLLSATASAIQIAHRATRVRRRDRRLFTTPSEAARSRFVRAGFDPESIVVKPNFVPIDHGPGSHKGGFALFVGRLSPEKGVCTLLRAWEQVPPGIQLKIVGDGPQRAEVISAASRNQSIEWLGQRPGHEAIEIMGDAALLVFPSECNETFGLSVAEAFSRGTPVLASNLGAPMDLVRPGYSGMHFNAGDPADLAVKTTELFETPGMIERLGEGARKEFTSRYTAAANYDMLMSVYRQAQRRQESAVGATGNHPAH